MELDADAVGRAVSVPQPTRTDPDGRRDGRQGPEPSLQLRRLSLRLTAAMRLARCVFPVLTVVSQGCRVKKHQADRCFRKAGRAAAPRCERGCSGTRLVCVCERKTNGIFLQNSHSVAFTLK